MDGRPPMWGGRTRVPRPIEMGEAGARPSDGRRLTVRCRAARSLAAAMGWEVMRWPPPVYESAARGCPPLADPARGLAPTTPGARAACERERARAREREREREQARCWARRRARARRWASTWRCRSGRCARRSRRWPSCATVRRDGHASGRVTPSPPDPRTCGAQRSSTRRTARATRGSAGSGRSEAEARPASGSRRGRGVGGRRAGGRCVGVLLEQARARSATELDAGSCASSPCCASLALRLSSSCYTSRAAPRRAQTTPRRRSLRQQRHDNRPTAPMASRVAPSTSCPLRLL
eukprot:scaffold774_cov249-Prasinococcus_capsulatus_cf.AAC.2